MSNPQNLYMSLNHIRNCLVPREWDRKTRLPLVLQFLPYWDKEDSIKNWSCNEEFTNPYANVDNFCSGNRSGNAVRNRNELSLIIELLENSDPRDPKSYLQETLALQNKWITGSPKVTRNNEAFTLEYISKAKPTEREIAFFADLKKTVDALRSIDNEESLTYALFLIVMVGVLQERIMKIPKICDWSYIHRIYPDSIPSAPPLVSGTSTDPDADTHSNSAYGNAKSLPRRGTPFIAAAINNYSRSDIESIDMAFHSGKHWVDDDERIDLLELMIKKRIRLRVLINSEDALANIWPHTRRIPRSINAQQSYISNWKDWERAYPDTIEVRVSNIPLLHRTYLIRCKDNRCIANITCYTYGKYASGKDIRMCYGENDSESLVFAEEFSYLWQQAQKTDP